MRLGVGRRPVKAPRQPAWAAPITPAAASANSTGAQSAASTPRAIPGRVVTMASAFGASIRSQGVSTSITSGLWI